MGCLKKAVVVMLLIFSIFYVFMLGYVIYVYESLIP